jgi:sulfatase modifying factor 1
MPVQSTWVVLTAAINLTLAGCSRDTRLPGGSARVPDGPSDAPVDVGAPADAAAIDQPVELAAPEVAAPDMAAACSGCLPLEQCWNGLCVARLVAVPAGFSIDATEVTRRQYAAWLATTPPSSGQDGRCAWNDRFAPDAACMALPSVCQGEACGQHPQPCVDLCDAAAYCRAVGKRLCGGFAGMSPVGPGFNARNNAMVSQWFNACTSNGRYDVTHGIERARGACNDYSIHQTTTVPVGSMLGCQSPSPAYQGIFDLIGNVEEWEDNCFTHPDSLEGCSPRGLSFGPGAQVPRCTADGFAMRAETRDNLGFRCCAD